MTLCVDIGGKQFTGTGRGEGERRALAPVRFEVKQGSFTCILGPSGCGKSTLINIIGGLETPDSGGVFLDGQALRSDQTGYMFQTPRLMPWLSALANVELVMDTSARHTDQAQVLLGEMGLAESLNVYANRLSGGMQRRVALARAFINRPPLLLMDEPFISLDDPSAHKLRLLLLRFWRERQTTVLFVTHNLHEALFLADRILFFSPGPGRVILNYDVPSPHPRDSLDEATVSARQAELLRQYPDLLSGVA